jgi:hypothetical protein
MSDWRPAVVHGNWRIDLCTEVSLLPAYLAAPREGHLDAPLHLRANLKQRHNTRLVFDQISPEIEFEAFDYDKPWIDFYGDVKEPMCHPSRLKRAENLLTSELLWTVTMTFTWRSCTWCLIYLNNCLITWLSNRHPTVECSVFGAEVVSMKHVMEKKLRGLG